MSLDFSKEFYQPKGEPMLDLNMFPERQYRILAVIERIRGQGGEEYQGSGSTEHKSRRNPVREDTAPLLQAYAALLKPRQIFEMGTAYGFSTLHLGLGSSQSRIITVEFETDVASEAQANLDEAGLEAFVFHGTAESAIRTTVPKPDLVFMDHDKGSYLKDFQLLEPRLVPGALILADNVNDRRSECADFVDYMFAKYPDTEILATECGLLVARVPSFSPSTASVREAAYVEA